MVVGFIPSLYLEDLMLLKNIARYMIDTVGYYLEKIRVIKLLEKEKILARAQKKAGLTDFGDDNFLEPLTALLLSKDLKKRPFFERYYIHHWFIRLLQSRLEVQDELNRKPEIMSKPVKRPLIVTGLPRTGTSMLQYLLSQDPNCRPLRHWETFFPVPAPDPATYDTDPRIARAAKEIYKFEKKRPEVAAKHHSTAIKPEECTFLLQYAMYSNRFPTEDYKNWFYHTPKPKVFEFLYKELQILQYNFPPAHWVLKDPQFINDLDSVFHAFPDACVINLHRPLVSCIPSHISLSLTIYRMEIEKLPFDFFKKKVDDFLWSRERMLVRLLEYRKSGKNADRILDVSYKKLMKDPVGYIRKIYDHFGYEFTDEFKKRIQNWLDQYPKNKFGVHKYSLEDYKPYGLSKETLDERYAEYQEYFKEYL